MSELRRQGRLLSHPYAWGIRIEDARGREITMIDLMHPKQFVPWFADAPLGVQLRVIRKIKRSGAWIGACAIFAVILGLVATAHIRSIMFWIGLPGATLLNRSMIPGWVAVGWLTLMLAHMVTRGHLSRNHSRLIAEAFLETGHCASCAHELEGLPAASDGCTVCPECGAAWMIKPVSPEVA